MINALLVFLVILGCYFLGFWNGAHQERKKNGKVAVWRDMIIQDLRRQNAILMKKQEEKNGNI